ncbi:hypothetical protein EGW08_015200 [Elysia chlorotica]|uniref:Uncharacterized protein n=1 Tax=Elysia chlorotica TaxID=188477 RepID=A0A433T638_ELYCH|nr:hypothetical protein EGW08_015200 [Elysia chlorotica]
MVWYLGEKRHKEMGDYKNWVRGQPGPRTSMVLYREPRSGSVGWLGDWAMDTSWPTRYTHPFICEKSARRQNQTAAGGWGGAVAGLGVLYETLCIYLRSQTKAKKYKRVSYGSHSPTPATSVRLALGLNENMRSRAAVEGNQVMHLPVLLQRIVSYVHLLVLATVWLPPSSPIYHRHRFKDLQRLWESPAQHPNEPCSLTRQTGCGPDRCCVKEVISFQDLDKLPVVRMLCQPHRAQGELCLRQTEGYLCDCAKGLVCRHVHNESYGHCGPG